MSEMLQQYLREELAKQMEAFYEAFGYPDELK